MNGSHAKALVVYLAEGLDCLDRVKTAKLEYQIEAQGDPMYKLEKIVQLLKGSIVQKTPMDFQQGVLVLEYMVATHSGLVYEQ